MRFTASLLLACLPFTAYAGGVAWSWKIADIATSADGITEIKLQPLELGDKFPLKCSPLKVTAKYDWPWWSFESVPVLEPQHWQAVGFLVHAHQTGTPVQFGEMGGGFGALEPTASCNVTSKGLAIYEGAVYSFTKWP